MKKLLFSIFFLSSLLIASDIYYLDNIAYIYKELSRIIIIIALIYFNFNLLRLVKSQRFNFVIIYIALLFIIFIYFYYSLKFSLLTKFINVIVFLSLFALGLYLISVFIKRKFLQNILIVILTSSILAISYFYVINFKEKIDEKELRQNLNKIYANMGYYVAFEQLSKLGNNKETNATQIVLFIKEVAKDNNKTINSNKTLKYFYKNAKKMIEED